MNTYLLAVHDSEGVYIISKFANNREDAESKFAEQLVNEYNLQDIFTVDWEQFAKELGDNYIQLSDIYSIDEFC